jgi:hypothetical protein
MMNTFSVCANPGCGRAFQAGQGRFFRFSQGKHCKIANAHAVRHYWLCEECLVEHTLEDRQDLGIVIIDRFVEPQKARLSRKVAAA